VRKMPCFLQGYFFRNKEKLSDGGKNKVGGRPYKKTPPGGLPEGAKKHFSNPIDNDVLSYA